MAPGDTLFLVFDDPALPLAEWLGGAGHRDMVATFHRAPHGGTVASLRRR